MSSSRFRAAVLAAFLATACAPPAAGLQAPDEVSLAGGIVHLFDDERTGVGGLEARFPSFRLPLGRNDLPLVPALGVTVDGDGGTYAYLSFRLDAADAMALLRGEPDGEAGGGIDGADRRWRLVGFTGLGRYWQATDGRDLGGPLEFRSGIELSRRLGTRSRLGVLVDHVSNAGIYDTNGGSENLMLVWSWRPLNR